MSTSTGPAYLLKAPYSLFDVINNVNEIEKSIKDHWHNEFVKEMIKSYYYDIEHVSFKEFFKQKINEAKAKGATSINKITSYEDPSFVFHQNELTKEIVVRLINFTEEAENIYKTYDYCGESKEYYNSTDSQLSYLTEEEWESRRLFWKNIGKAALKKEVYQPYELKVNYETALNLSKTLRLDDSFNWRSTFSTVFLSQEEIHAQVLNQNWSVIGNALRYVATGNMSELETTNEIINKVTEKTDVIFNSKVKPFTE